MIYNAPPGFTLQRFELQNIFFLFYVGPIQTDLFCYPLLHHCVYYIHANKLLLLLLLFRFLLHYHLDSVIKKHAYLKTFFIVVSIMHSSILHVKS